MPTHCRTVFRPERRARLVQEGGGGDEEEEGGGGPGEQRLQQAAAVAAAAAAAAAAVRRVSGDVDCTCTGRMCGCPLTVTAVITHVCSSLPSGHPAQPGRAEHGLRADDDVPIRLFFTGDSAVPGWAVDNRQLPCCRQRSCWPTGHGAHAVDVARPRCRTCVSAGGGSGYSSALDARLSSTSATSDGSLGGASDAAVADELGNADLTSC